MMATVPQLYQQTYSGVIPPRLANHLRSRKSKGPAPSPEEPHLSSSAIFSLLEAPHANFSDTMRDLCISTNVIVSD